jgi:D-Tyr-tRNAtyr deacylase
MINQRLRVGDIIYLDDKPRSKWQGHVTIVSQDKFTMHWDVRAGNKPGYATFKISDLATPPWRHFTVEQKRKLTVII